MAAKAKFPYKAFILTPSYNLRQVTVVKKSAWYGLALDTGTSVSASALFDTKKAAIAHGKKAIEQRRARLAKSTVNIEKHAANLAEAEGGNG